jgi:hypothetical protein
VASERFDAYSVEVLLLNLGEFTPNRTWGLAKKIMLGLRNFTHYWQVRIKITGDPTDKYMGVEYAGVETLTWIAIDKYQFSPYCGKVTVVRFDHIAEFLRKYWGTDFGFGP